MQTVEQKKILILGATNIISEIVKEAKKMGLYTIVVDYNKEAPAKKLADESWLIDVFDIDKIAEKIKENPVDGIITGYTDSIIPAYYEICKRTGKPCYISSKTQIDFAIKKNIFKEICREYSVPVVPEYNNINEIEYPVLVKPVDNSGSRGIFVCNNKEEYLTNYEKSLKYSKCKKVITEKYIQGDEIVIYYAFQNGEIINTAICDRYVDRSQKGLAQLPTSYIFPSKYTDLYINLVDEKVKNMFKNIGIQNGAMFLQAFVIEDKIYLYEPGYRLNGAQEHIILSHLSGFNTQKMFINYAITGKMSDDIQISKAANPHLKKFACKLSPLVKPGIIKSIEGMDTIRKMEGVIDIKPLYHQGEKVGGLGSLQQIIARFFIVADTIDEMAEIIDKIQSKLSVKNENGVEMIYGLFDTKILETYKELVK